MIESLDLYLEFVNSELSSDDMIEFERQAKDLLINHILTPYTTNGSLDVKAIHEEIKMVNLEEINRDKIAEQDIEVNRELLNAPNLIEIDEEKNIRIICNFEQFKVLQHYIITNFPTYSYEDSGIDNTTIPFRQPVSIIPQLLLNGLILAPENAIVKAYLECKNGSQGLDAPKKLPIQKISVQLYAREKIWLDMMRCDENHSDQFQELGFEIERQIPQTYYETFNIKFFSVS